MDLRNYIFEKDLVLVVTAYGGYADWNRFGTNLNSGRFNNMLKASSIDESGNITSGYLNYFLAN